MTNDGIGMFISVFPEVKDSSDSLLITFYHFNSELEAVRHKVKLSMF